MQPINPLLAYTLNIYYAGCLFIAKLLAVERTTSLLNSDCLRRPLCSAQLCSVPLWKRLSV